VLQPSQTGLGLLDMADYPNRIESLLDQGELLGRLARALVRDENTADDLVQETWLAALQTPPEGNVRSWFAVVARNLVRREARTSSIFTKGENLTRIVRPMFRGRATHDLCRKYALLLNDLRGMKDNTTGCLRKEQKGLRT
jgi:hypothetical protein